jgi:hypothetical protein
MNAFVAPTLHYRRGFRLGVVPLLGPKPVITAWASGVGASALFELVCAAFQP